MCRNVGGLDRFARLLLGALAILAAFMWLGASSGNLPGILVGVVGVVLILTAVVGFCPLYLPLKLSTCKVTK